MYFIFDIILLMKSKYDKINVAFSLMDFMKCVGDKKPMC
jgi:hypothetical protein